MSRKPPPKTSLSFEVRARLLNRLMGIGPDLPNESGDENEPPATPTQNPTPNPDPQLQTTDQNNTKHLHNDS